MKITMNSFTLFYASIQSKFYAKKEFRSLTL